MELFEGRLGQPPGGFPQELQKRVLRGRKPLTDRPGASLPPADFAGPREELQKQLRRPAGRARGRHAAALPARLPGVRRPRAEVLRHERAADAGVLLRHGAGRGDQRRHRAGQDADHQFLTVGDPHADGTRVVFFELNGRRARWWCRIGRGPQGAAPAEGRAGQPAARGGADAGAGGAACWWRPARRWRRGRSCVTLEAMKMETTFYAERAGTRRRGAGQAGHAGRGGGSAAAVRGIAAAIRGIQSRQGVFRLPRV